VAASIPACGHTRHDGGEQARSNEMLDDNTSNHSVRQGLGAKPARVFQRISEGVRGVVDAPVSNSSTLPVRKIPTLDMYAKQPVFHRDHRPGVAANVVNHVDDGAPAMTRPQTRIGRRRGAHFDFGV
jgi:hypothetical protein